MLCMKCQTPICALHATKYGIFCVKRLSGGQRGFLFCQLASIPNRKIMKTNIQLPTLPPYRITSVIRMVGRVRCKVAVAPGLNEAGLVELASEFKRLTGARSVTAHQDIYHVNVEVFYG